MKSKNEMRILKHNSSLRNKYKGERLTGKHCLKRTRKLKHELGF